MKKIPNIKQTTIVVATGKAPEKALKRGGREAAVYEAVKGLGRGTATMVFQRVMKVRDQTRSAWQDVCWILRGFARAGLVEIRPDRRAGDSRGRVLYMVVKPDRRRDVAERAVPAAQLMRLIKGGRVMVVKAS